LGSGETCTVGKYEALWGALPDYVKGLIDKYYSECGLKDLILDEIAEAIERTKTWRYPITPSSRRIVYGLEKCINQAKSLADKHQRDFCHYLTLSLRRRWFLNWVAPG
jgi:hypothetical protein